MKRITPEEVVAAYKETGLKPEQGITLADGCACGLGVIYAQKFGVLEADSYDVFNALERDLSPAYIYGFIAGFDGIDYTTIGLREGESIGYEDGRACWKAVVVSGLVEG
jgi:hypothetical protein